MALTVGQRFADFEILGEIGRGGMGTVYQARQISLQRVVALKILPPHMAGRDSESRFETEAVAAATVNHQNIVQVFSAGEHDGIRYIAMEFVEGESIQERIKRLGRLPLTEALDIAYHVACALDHAWNAAALIHRDVKPDNIFLSKSGTVKLGDFGLAKMLRDDAGTSITVTGHAMGSPHFISPEQAHGHRDIDFRADIYSLGCALHYMATGRMVFEGPDFLSIVLKHVNEPPQPLQATLADCPASFERLVSRMLKKDRTERHQSYTELIDELLHARSDAAVWEASDARQRRRMAAESGVGRVRRIAGLLALGALLVAGGFVYARRMEGLRSAQSSVVTLADPSDRRDFNEAMARLGPEERVNRVVEKLREVNPGFTGRVKKTFEEEAVVELSFSTVGVTNLWPLCALKHLRVLHCTGDSTREVTGTLVDLSPLADLEDLEELDCSWNQVKDLRPLRDLPLTTVRCSHTAVQDVTALSGLALTELDISGTPVRDLEPLAGLPIEHFRCNGTRIRDLAALRNAPLKMLWCDVKTLTAPVVKSWKHIEMINDAPVAEVTRRLRR